MPLIPHYPALAEVVRRDPRFPLEAYEFVVAAYQYTQKMLGRPIRAEYEPENPQHHVTGRQLLEGVRILALREFGMMARTVFRCWGIQRTDDFGDMVFNLVDAGLMSKTDQDSREDFHDVYDLDEALGRDFQIQIEEDA